MLKILLEGRQIHCCRSTRNHWSWQKTKGYRAYPLSNKLIYMKKVILGVLIAGSIAIYFSPRDQITDLVTNKTPLQEKVLKHFKQDRPDLFAEVFAAMREPAGNNSPAYAHSYRYDAWQEAKKTSRGAMEELPWEERGPGNVSGRTRGLLFDPGDTTLQTIYAGAVGGGVWRSEDGAETWTHLTEGLPHLAIGDLAISPAEPNTIYAGTGEGLLSLPAIDGIGIWKSVDQGLNWSPLQSTLDDPRFGSVTRMIINPSDEDQLFVGVNNAIRNGRSYILRTDDGGESWETVLVAEGGRLFGVIQQIFSTNDFAQIFASINGMGIVRSQDLGMSWDTIYKAREGQERIEAAVYSQDPDILYAAIEDGSGIGNRGSGLFRTLNGGTSWHQIQRENNFELANWLGGQGWYDNTIAIHPSDPMKVYAGGQPGIFVFETMDEIVERTDESIEDNSDALDLTEDLSLLQFPFDDFGPTEDLAVLLGVTTGVSASDRFEVEIEFAANEESPIHRLGPLLNGAGLPEFDTLINAGIKAINSETGESLVMAFADENSNGRWDAPVFPGDDLEELELIEPLFVYTLPRSQQANPEIALNPFHQNMYTVMVVQSFDQEEDSTILNGSFSIEQVTFEASEASQDFLVGGFKGVHVDHHNIQLREKDGNLYVLNGNDGGVSYSTDDAENFIQTGNSSMGYNTAQFYGVDKMNGEDRYIAGSQDNGSYFSPGDPDATTAWQIAPSGDGFEAIWNYANPDLMLESLQFNGIFKSSDRGANWQIVDLPSGADDGPFVTQLAGSKSDPDLVYGLSSAGVIRSTDFGSSWTIVEMPEEWVFDGGYAPIEVSLTDPNIVWTGGALSEDDRLVVSDNGGTVFKPVKRYDGPTGQITGIATHPSASETAYILFGAPGTAKILKTTDLGETWEDISGFRNPANGLSTNGFPNVVTYSLLVMPFDHEQIWAGTEIGLFISMNAGDTWELAENGLPNTAIWDMKIVNDEVVVATHGRGIWTVAMPLLEDYEPVASTLAPRFIDLTQEIRTGDVEVTFELRQAYDSSFIEFSVGDQVLDVFSLGRNSEPDIATILNNFNDVVPDDTIVQVLAQIKGFVSGRELVGARQNVEVYLLDNDFVTIGFVDSLNNTNRGNFARRGFTIGQEDGFDDPALQSQHPHEQATNLLAVFQKPVVVNSITNRVIYDQILILEPGETNNINSDDFFDFGALEGSSDYGQTWTILSGGDAREDEDWLSLFDNGDAPSSEEAYRLAEVDLFDTYDDQDTILLRFRLFSDPFVVGWGMAVDNFTIGEPELSNQELELNAEVSVYPNPFADYLNVEINGLDGEARIDIISLQGILIESREINLLSLQQRITHTFTTDKMSPGTYFVRISQGGKRKTMPVLKM